MNVPRPDKSTVSLAACPCAADKVHGSFHTGLPLSLVKGSGIKLGINISDFGCRPHKITVVIIIVYRKFRLRLIQPEHLDSVIIVIFLAKLPYIIPRPGIGSVKKGIFPFKTHGNLHAAFIFNQQAVFAHFFIVFACQVNLRPDGYHQLHPVFPKLVNHRFGIREIRFIEPEIPAFGPMVKIHHNHVHRNPSFMVFPGDL